MNAAEWIKLKSGASSVGGKMKVLKFLCFAGGNRNQCDHLGKHLAVHMVPTNSKWTYDPTVLFLSTQPVRMVAYIHRNFF